MLHAPSLTRSAASACNRNDDEGMRSLCAIFPTCRRLTARLGRLAQCTPRAIGSGRAQGDWLTARPSFSFSILQPKTQQHFLHPLFVLFTPTGMCHLHPKSPQHPCIQLARKVRKNVRNAFTRARNTRTAGQVSNAAGTERTQGDGLTAMIGDCFKTGERTHKKSISRIRGHCCMHHR